VPKFAPAFDQLENVSVVAVVVASAGWSAV
jgi:hypothetical protein